MGEGPCESVELADTKKVDRSARRLCVVVILSACTATDDQQLTLGSPSLGSQLWRDSCRRWVHIEFRSSDFCPTDTDACSGVHAPDPHSTRAASSMPAPAAKLIGHHFDGDRSDRRVEILITSSYVLGLGLGPFLFARMSWTRPP
jgi:hypothetical protein